MARPRSGNKRQAILDAALTICAERGIGGAPTSAISKTAGIAEGSLFTYFKTKDELLKELYLTLKAEFSKHLTEFPHGADPRTRMRYIWDVFMQLGSEHPEQLKVLGELRASGRLYKDDEPPNFAAVEMLKLAGEATRDAGLEGVSTEYLILMIRSQMEITVQFINAHPSTAAVCQENGFNILWRGLTGHSDAVQRAYVERYEQISA